MFGVRVKIVTIVRPDEKPTVNWIFPDESMKEERKVEGKIKDMVLIHEHDNHFNMIGSFLQGIVQGSPSNKDIHFFNRVD